MQWFKDSLDDNFDKYPNLSFEEYGIWNFLKERILIIEGPIRIDTLPRQIKPKHIKKLKENGLLFEKNGQVFSNFCENILKEHESFKEKNNERQKKSRLKSENVTRDNDVMSQAGHKNVTSLISEHNRREEKKEQKKWRRQKSTTGPESESEPPPFSETSLSDKELIEKYIDCQKRDGKKIPNSGGYRKTLINQLSVAPETERKNYESYIAESEKKQNSAKVGDDMSLLYDYDDGFGNEWDAIRSMTERLQGIYRERAVKIIKRGSEWEINLEMCRQYRQEKKPDYVYLN